MSGSLARFYVFRSLGLTWLYVPFQWFYLSSQGLGATELMALNTVFCIAAVLLEVPTGVIADRIGRKPVLVVGAAASTLSCLAFVLLPGSFAGLAAANVLAALAMTCISGADSAYLFDLVGGRSDPREYQRAEAVSTAIRLATAALGGLAAWAIVARGGGLSTLYLATAVLTSVAALVGLSLDESRPAARPRRGGPGLVSALAVGAAELVAHARRGASIAMGRREMVVLLLLSALLFPVLRVGLFLDQPFLRSLGVATAAVGLAFAAKDLVAAVAAAAVVRLLPLVGARRLFLALPVATGLALAAMGLARGPEAALLIVLPTAAFGVYSPLVRVFVNGRIAAGAERATVLSIEGMARRVGFALFSPLVGAAFDLWSLRAALAVSGLWAVGALGVALLLACLGRLAPEPDGERAGLSSPRPATAHRAALSVASPRSAFLALASSVRPPSLVSSGSFAERVKGGEVARPLGEDKAA